ncbi:MAG TPA: hypothetical protein VIL85_22455 [Thermomicrobiales bacterium]
MLTINDLMATLVAELEAEEVVTPLAQRFTLANIWADLARLSGEALPAVALAVVGDTLDTICEPLPLRGSYRDHAAQFPELGGRDPRAVAEWLPAD